MYKKLNTHKQIKSWSNRFGKHKIWTEYNKYERGGTLVLGGLDLLNQRTQSNSRVSAWRVNNNDIKIERKKEGKKEEKKEEEKEREKGRKKEGKTERQKERKRDVQNPCPSPSGPRRPWLRVVPWAFLQSWTCLRDPWPSAQRAAWPVGFPGPSNQSHGTWGNKNGWPGHGWEGLDVVRDNTT